MGVMLSAVDPFNGLRTSLVKRRQPESEGGPNAYDSTQAAQVPQDSEVVCFFHLSGGVRIDPHAVVLIGSSLRHDLKHMADRCAGSKLWLNDSLSLMRKLSIDPSNVILTGRYPFGFMEQMLYDVFQADCSLVNAKEGCYRRHYWEQ